ncbi:MAG: hypothetical protein WBV28_09200 [Terracidiphilus sp.]
MDILPIGGIRAFPAGSAMRADAAAPRFEIGASRRADEETYSSSSESSDQDAEDEKGEKIVEPVLRAQEVSETASPDLEEGTAGTQIDVVA